MPVSLLQLSFYLILLLGCLCHRNMKQFVQGHSGKQCAFFCQPHWSPASHHKAQIFLAHRRCKAAGRCTGNGQQILTHVMTIQLTWQSRQDESVCYCIQAPKAVKKQTASFYQFLYLNRLQNLRFFHLHVVKNMINQVLCISDGLFLKTGWICKEEEGNKKLEFYWGIQKICRPSTKGRSLQLLDIL